jgi:xylan 1,4-beta-xylosidase
VAGYQRSIAEIKDRPEAVGNPSLEANVFNTPFMTANPTLPRFYVFTMLVVAIVFGQPFTLMAASGAAPSPEPAVRDQVINVDVKAVQGPLDTSFKECIGAGRANEGLRADWQDQLREARRDCGFKYIRMHGLLTDDMGVYKEDAHGNPGYNWQYIDQLYDFLLSINIKPFVELSFMPRDLASGSKTIFWWKGNVTPPKSYDKWADLIRHLVTHFQERYGHDEVKTWYFEVWNEPDLHNGFWTGTKADYFKLYEVTAGAVKSVSPDYRVGGPATAMGQWDESFLGFCSSNNVPIDFVSSHNYGVKSGYLDETGQRGTVIDPSPDSVVGRMINERKMIDHSPLPNPAAFHRVEFGLHAHRFHA